MVSFQYAYWLVTRTYRFIAILCVAVVIAFALTPAALDLLCAALPAPEPLIPVMLVLAVAGFAYASDVQPLAFLPVVSPRPPPIG